MIRKFRSRESGMSAIPFVVSLFVIAGFAIAWYNADQEATDLRGKLRTAQTAEASERERYETVNRRLIELNDVVGVGDSEGKPDKAALQAALAGALERWRERMAIEFTADKYTATGTGGQVEKLQGDKIRVVYVPPKDVLPNPTVPQVLAIFEAAAARMQADVKRYVEATDAEKKSKEEQKRSYDTAIAAQKAEYDRLRAEYDQAKRTADEQLREVRDQSAAKDQTIAQVQSELETVRAESERTITSLQAANAQSRAEIQTIVRRDKPTLSEGPDGEVVAAGSGLVIVNRGKKDWLMPGTTFTVLGRIKGGDLVPKGSIKCTTVHDGTADCRIVEESPNNPIGAGDLIQSAVYSPNRKLRFVLVGDFRKVGRSQAEARLKELGAAVDPSVTTETNYLVLGAAPAGETLEESEAYKKAREFGVTVLTEAELASFTLY